MIEPPPKSIDYFGHAEEVRDDADEHKLLLSDDKSLPPFLFRNVGNDWIVRFQTGETVEKGTVPNLKGCQHYQRLLNSPYKEITCLDLDPREVANAAAGGSAVSENEHHDEPGYDGDDHKTTFRKFLHDDVSRGLLEEIAKLDEQIESESDEAKKNRLKEVRAQAQASLRDYIGMERSDVESVRAYNRVRKAMRDARMAIKTMGGLDRFVEHLERSVQPMNQVWAGHGFRYAPESEPNWTF